MTFDEFITKYKGKAIDYDGTAGVQCVDLAKQYMHDVLGMSPGAWGNAHCYWDNFDSIAALKSNFTKVSNTSSFVPQKGDVAVWSTKLGKYGHIAICDGVGTTGYFYSYDQNWTGNHDKTTRIKHTYTSIAGFLRPKNQTKVLGSSSIASTATTSAGKSIGTIFVANTKSYTTVDSLRVRKSPSLSAATVSSLKKGAWVNLKSFSYEGTRTWAKTDTGYICVCEDSKIYIHVEAKTTAALNYRDAAKTGKVLGTFAKGTKITTIDREAYGWASCIKDGKRVWFSLEYCTHG